MGAQDADGGMERTGETATARQRDHGSTGRAAASGFDPRPLVAILGLAGFAIITWAVASGFVFPFDQPLLDAGKGLGQYMPEWRGLSDSPTYL